MFSDNLKRRIKNKINTEGTKQFSLTTILIVAVILTTVVFCFSQLAINADLNPKGLKLEALNREKNALIEENRQLSQEIAESESLPIVSNIAQKKLALQNTNQKSLIYVADPGILAGR